MDLEKELVKKIQQMRWKGNSMAYIAEKLKITIEDVKKALKMRLK